MARQTWSKQTVTSPWGFEILADIPEQSELAEYYASRYYQENLGIYQASYEELETRWIAAMVDRKYRMLRTFAPEVTTSGSYLDVGCGEANSVDYFHRMGWQVKGLDFSIAGVRNHHPDLEQYVTAGDLFELLDEVIDSGEVFDVVWLDNVLEHVRDPLALLTRCRNVVAPGGAFVVEVPNDFSIVQRDLAEKGVIEDRSWVFPPDHISYFSRASLLALAQDAGWTARGVSTNIPIDWFLYHPGSNYYADRSVGKDAHHARMMIEMLIMDQDPDKALNLSVALAELGMGREIMAVFTATSDS